MRFAPLLCVAVVGKELDLFTDYPELVPYLSPCVQGFAPLVRAHDGVKPVIPGLGSGNSGSHGGHGTHASNHATPSASSGTTGAAPGTPTLPRKFPLDPALQTTIDHTVRYHYLVPPPAQSDPLSVTSAHGQASTPGFASIGDRLSIGSGSSSTGGHVSTSSTHGTTTSHAPWDLFSGGHGHGGPSDSRQPVSTSTPVSLSGHAMHALRVFQLNAKRFADEVRACGGAGRSDLVLPVGADRPCVTVVVAKPVANSSVGSGTPAQA